MLAPTSHLALDVAVGPTELAETGRAIVDTVDRDEHVDELFGTAARVVVRQRSDFLRRAEDDAVDLLHHVEGRVVDGEVLAERERGRNGDVGGSEGREHRVLARHVVRGRQHVAERRAAQNPLVRLVAD